MIFMEAEQLRLVLGAVSAGLRGDRECPGAAVGASCQLLVGTYARGERPTPIIREETAAAWPLRVVSAHPPPGRVIRFPRGADGLLAGVGPAPQSCPTELPRTAALPAPPKLAPQSRPPVAAGQPT